MKFYKESQLKTYNSYTNEQLLSLWKNDKNEMARIVLAKRNHNFSGDVYFHDGYISSLERHKEIYKDSVAVTIEEAGTEYLVKLAELENETQN